MPATLDFTSPTPFARQMREVLVKKNGIGRTTRCLLAICPVGIDWKCTSLLIRQLFQDLCGLKNWMRLEFLPTELKARFELCNSYLKI